MSTRLPSAGSMRQKLRTILDEYVLPEVRVNKSLRMLSAQLPLKAPDGVSIQALSIAPLDERKASDNYPTGLEWEEWGVHAIQFPVLCCVFAGEIDLRIGVTTAMLKNFSSHRQQCGGYVVSLPAPSFFIIPAHVPYPTGTWFPWERDEPEKASAHILWLRVLPTGALCHTTLIYNGQQEPQYSLLLEDELLAPMMDILLAALHPATGNPEIARAQLLALCLRVEQDLQRSAPLMTDGIASRFPAGKTLQEKIERTSSASDAAFPVLEKACEYIQLHLHEPITPADIAGHVRLKPTQLSRAFQKRFGTSLMRYVMRQRMETARLLLQTSELSVQEISRLVGFKYLSHFTRAFVEHEGMPPLRFRQLQAHHYHLHRAKA